MNLKQMIGQHLMTGIRGFSLDEETRAHLKEISPGGVILFSRNIHNRDQVCDLIKDIKETVQPPPLIAIDQEGGLIVRFFRDVSVMPGNMALGAVDSPEQAYKQGWLMARELKSIGIDINLAPVVDVVTGYDNPGITIRAFGSDPNKVALLGVNFIQGTQAGGLGAVAKHFPGKGAAAEDAHFELPAIDLSWEEMVKTHLYPFRKCIEHGVQGIMSSHVIYRRLPGSEKIPATFSSKLIKDHLRGDMKFSGVIFSDDLEMGAISRYFSFDKAVIEAIRAGHDMLLICSDYDKQRLASRALLKACRMDKTMFEEMGKSVNRIELMRNFSQKTEDSKKPQSETDALNFAGKIAEGSITLLKGCVQVPIPFVESKDILAIIPDLSQLDSIEEGFEAGDSNFIGEALKAKFPVSGQTEFISLDPHEEELEKTWERAQRADLVMAFIFNARFLKGQRLLLEKLKALPQKTIFILIRNPFDLEFLGPEMTTVITYGYRKAQIAAAIKVLGGEIPALGKLPFKRIIN